ncbi:hypothetical protein QOT17_006509 [Balamuthia mandrillaris]
MNFVIVVCKSKEALQLLPGGVARAILHHLDLALHRTNSVARHHVFSTKEASNFEAKNILYNRKHCRDGKEEDLESMRIKAGAAIEAPFGIKMRLIHKCVPSSTSLWHASRLTSS